MERPNQQSRAVDAKRSYDLVRTGGFIRERSFITLHDVSMVDGSSEPQVAPVPLACDRSLPRWFVYTTLALLATLPVSFLAGAISGAGSPVFVIAAWVFGGAIVLSLLIAVGMAIAPVRVYRIGVPIDERRIEPPIVTIRQRAIGHRKYVVQDESGKKLARIRRRLAAGHLRIDRIQSAGDHFDQDAFNPVMVRARISRRLTAGKAAISALDIASSVSNLIHPPWNAVRFAARLKHDPRPKGEAWPLATAEKGTSPGSMRLTIDRGVVDGVGHEALPDDLVLLAAACLLLSFESDR